MMREVGGKGVVWGLMIVASPAKHEQLPPTAIKMSNFIEPSNGLLTNTIGRPSVAFRLTQDSNSETLNAYGKGASVSAKEYRKGEVELSFTQSMSTYVEGGWSLRRNSAPRSSHSY